MTELYRVRAGISGLPSGPGVSTMYFLDKQTAVASVRAFWAGFAGGLPLNVAIQVENTGDIIESTTGQLTGAWTSAPVDQVLGTAIGAYAAPTGMVVNWLTNVITGGRRLRGRTFIVPMALSAYDTDGTVSQVTLTAIRAAADSLLFEQSLSLAVWGRPRAARAADGSRPAVTARAGTSGLVTATRVPDKVVVLRSRRD